VSDSGRRTAAEREAARRERELRRARLSNQPARGRQAERNQQVAELDANAPLTDSRWEQLPAQPHTNGPDADPAESPPEPGAQIEASPNAGDELTQHGYLDEDVERDGYVDEDVESDGHRDEDIESDGHRDESVERDGYADEDGEESTARGEDPEGRGHPDDDLDEDEYLDDEGEEPLYLGEAAATTGDEDLQAPAGTRRVTRLTHPKSHRDRKGSKVRPPLTSAAGGRRHSWVGRFASLAALLLAAGVIWFLVQLFQPFHGSPHGSVTVTIPAHTSSRQVGDLLAHDGVIPSGFFFELRALLAGERSDLRTGTYHLQLGMSYASVLSKLTTPPHAAKVSELTITEGRTRRQIDALLRSQGVHGSYFAGTHHSPLLNPQKYGAPADTNSLEGFLFPSTYQVVDPIRINALVADQLRAFRKTFAKVNLSYARSKHLTPYDVLIIASMIEAEAATAHDRPLVSSVVYNRLRDGMPLQLDATTRYETGNYTKPLTASELNSSSPYNTRIHKGLPPTPIGNPGLAAIQAAAHPAHTKDLYFVVKPCGNGEQVFTSSYNQFLIDAQQYQAARAKRGGHSPAHC
jgi:UPF0755 protein